MKPLEHNDTISGPNRVYHFILHLLYVPDILSISTLLKQTATSCENSFLNEQITPPALLYNHYLSHTPTLYIVDKQL